jgi:hypothetical protein
VIGGTADPPYPEISRTASHVQGSRSPHPLVRFARCLSPDAGDVVLELFDDELLLCNGVLDHVTD